MKTVLFNIHDLVLILVLGLSILLAVISTRSELFKYPSRHILMAFFSLNAMIAFDTLVFWGEEVKYAVFSLSPWLLTLFSFATFAFGPMLYWFIRTELTERKTISRVDLLHLIPVILTPIYLYWITYRFPIDLQRELILNLGVYARPEAHFSEFILLKKLMPVIYGGLSLNLFYQAHQKHKISSQETTFLLYLVAGFGLIKLWALVTHICGVWLPLVSSDLMGILGNYMTLLLIITLLYKGFRESVQRKFEAFTPKKAANSADIREKEEAFEEEILAAYGKIKQFMEQEKPYLNARLTLERFSELLNIPPRLVSMAVNQSFNQNFQEFINSHRIEEAKRLLADSELSDLTIQQIAEKSGFNSKATFNRVFKIQTSVTPTAYRKDSNADQKMDLLLQESHSTGLNSFKS